ncbi:MAG: VOC family protein [Planctomycetes bacterium]|nr:VOC family protein [Planctomycetota bacterium]
MARVREAAEYYRDVLGFDLDPVDGVFQPLPDEPQGVYAIVSRGGAAVHLQVRRGAPAPQPRTALERDVYLYVDDVQALHDDLVRRGAKVLEPPHRTPYGLQEMVVEDRFGFRIAFGAAV